MPSFQIEMLWDCAVCKAVRNMGLEKHCKNCGHPKDDRDAEYMPDNVTVSMALQGDKKRRALAGPDFKCLFCGSLQNALNTCCTVCGAPKDKGSKGYQAKVQTATFDPLSGRRTTLTSKTVDVTPLPSREGGEPARPAAPPTPQEESSDAAAFRARLVHTRVLLSAIIGIPSILLVIALGWLLFRTRIVDVRVQQVAWRHEVAIDRWAVRHREGFDTDPGAFDVHDDGSRIHHYDTVQTGTHEEHYTVRVSCGQDCTTISGSCHTTPVSCTSNRNGTASCSGGDTVCDPDRQSCTTRYCSEDRTRTVADYTQVPRYREYYDWNVWDWAHDRTVATSGASIVETWPTDQALQPPSPLTQGEKEREAGRSMIHKVTFANDKGETWDITPGTCPQFEAYPVGGAWRLKVGVAHGVEVLPAK